MIDACGDDDDDGAGCCAGSARACVFAKALLARQAACALAERQAVGERDVLTCSQPVAQANCATLAALLRERATFALRLPRLGAPLVHARAMQLQCGGLRALRDQVGVAGPVDGDPFDVHRLMGEAHARWGSLMQAPWDRIVPAIVQWQPRRRVRPRAP